MAENDEPRRQRKPAGGAAGPAQAPAPGGAPTPEPPGAGQPGAAPAPAAPGPGPASAGRSRHRLVRLLRQADDHLTAAAVATANADVASARALVDQVITALGDHDDDDDDGDG